MSSRFCSLQPYFVGRVFTIFDSSNSGRMSRKDFVSTLHTIMEMTPDEKLRLLFKIYDLDGDDFITLGELRHVLTACMEENGLAFSADNLAHLTLTLFEDADRDSTGTISFDELRDLFQRNSGLTENISSSMERWLLPARPNETRPHPKQNFLRKLSLSYIANNSVSFAFFVAFLAIHLMLFLARWRQYRSASTFLMLARASGAYAVTR